MKKSKKPSSFKKIISNYKKTIIICSVLLIILLAADIFYISNSSKLDNTSIYYTGNLYSANQAANMLDYCSGNNIIISPLNINSNLAILYNGSDNTTNKELKNYFNQNTSFTNKELSTKLSTLTVENQPDNTYTKLYLSLIDELNKQDYQNLTTTKIKLLSQKEKRDLQLLLKKISLTLDRINKLNNLSEKNIKNYTLSEKEITTNEYNLYSLLQDVLDNYETYSIINKVINYNTIYVSDTLSEKDINKDYLNILDSYNSSISYLDYTNSQTSSTTINNNLKEITDNNLSRIISEDDFKDGAILVNTLYFNYEWAEPFSSANVSTETFYELDGDISQIEMMNGEVDTYLENHDYYGFTKDFQDSKYSFIAILPKTVGDFTLSSIDIDSLLASARSERVTIGLPKFSFQTETDLKSLLKNYNIQNTFSSKANFTKITDEDFTIDQDIQKISITIGEKGTINSSNTTSSTIESLTENNSKKLSFNRPFCFLIRNNETEDIILIGKVSTFKQN